MSPHAWTAIEFIGSGSIVGLFAAAGTVYASSRTGFALLLKSAARAQGSAAAAADYAKKIIAENVLLTVRVEALEREIADMKHAQELESEWKRAKERAKERATRAP